MKLKSVALSCLMLATPVLAWADPTGSYTIKGKNASDGSEYTGTVDVARTGQTYSVTWNVGGTTFVGTGLGAKFVDDGKRFEMSSASADDIAMSVGYKSGDTFGIAMFFQQPDGTWQGVWAYGGSDKVAPETWTRK